MVLMTAALLNATKLSRSKYWRSYVPLPMLVTVPLQKGAAVSAHPIPPRPRPNSYLPREGELVRDLVSGRVGQYMAPGFEKHPTVYLRPPGGGCEWEVSASDIEPVDFDGELALQVH
jgi:hypothetical protein